MLTRFTKIVVPASLTFAAFAAAADSTAPVYQAQCALVAFCRYTKGGCGTSFVKGEVFDSAQGKWTEKLDLTLQEFERISDIPARFSYLGYTYEFFAGASSYYDSDPATGKITSVGLMLKNKDDDFGAFATSSTRGGPSSRVEFLVPRKDRTPKSQGFSWAVSFICENR